MWVMLFCLDIEAMQMACGNCSLWFWIWMGQLRLTNFYVWVEIWRWEVARFHCFSADWIVVWGFDFYQLFFRDNVLKKIDSNECFLHLFTACCTWKCHCSFRIKSECKTIIWFLLLMIVLFIWMAIQGWSLRWNKLSY